MAKISKMIDNVTGKTEADLRLREQFTFLQKMARAKSEVFENRLKLMLSNKDTGNIEIVGNKAFEYHSCQHVNISSECNVAIGEAVDEFFKGKAGVKNGFQKIVKAGLAGLIGDTSLGETEEKMFFVFPENYSIVRVDVMAYKYTFTTKGVLAQNVENIFVYTMAKSIVDHTKVGTDYLLHVVVDMMEKNDQGLPNLKDVVDFIQELRFCWELLDTCNAGPKTVLEDAQKKSIPSYVSNEVGDIRTAFIANNPVPNNIENLVARS